MKIESYGISYSDFLMLPPQRILFLHFHYTVLIAGSIDRFSFKASRTNQLYLLVIVEREDVKGLVQAV